MIRKFEISGVHAKADEKLKDYVTNSVAKLEKYIPKHARKSVHVEVKLKESRSQGSNKSTVEYLMFLPNGQLMVKESTFDMHEAVDLVEGKMINRLKKYKEKHTGPRLTRRLARRFLRRQS